MTKLYAVTYVTESGDEGFVGIFAERPTDAHLATITRTDFPHEIVEEDGEELSYIFFAVHEADGVTPLPAPSAVIQGL